MTTATIDTAEVIENACRYARAGLRIFPVVMAEDRGDGKQPKEPPYGYLWKERATSRIAEVVQDFEDACHRYGADAIGVAWAVGLDGYVLVDLDHDEPDWWHELTSVPHIVNVTARGVHLAFKLPDDLAVSNSTQRFPSTEFGEVRGRGGYGIIDGPDRPGLDLEQFADVAVFPRLEWLTPAGDSADAAPPAEVAKFHEEHTEARRPGSIKGPERQLAEWVAMTEKERSIAKLPVSRHEMATRIGPWLAREAAAGRYTADDAYAALVAFWTEVMDDPRRRKNRELPSIWAWSIGQALAEPARIAAIRVDDELPAIERFEPDVDRGDTTTITEADDGTTSKPDPESVEGRVHAALERIHARTLDLRTVLPPPEPLIADVIDMATLVLLYARWGCFKSFLGIDWGFHIATGRRWMGHEVVRRPFVILGYEAPLSLHRRARAWCQYHGVEPAELDGWFHLDRRPRPLTDVIEREATRRWLDEIDAGVVMVDTIARTSVGVKANTEEMLSVYEAMTELTSDTRTVIGIGHAGKDTGKGMRGFSGQEDWADTIFMLDRARTNGGPHGPATLTNPKQKDRDTLAALAFDLATVNVDEMSSAVLVPTKVDQPATRQPQRPATPVEAAEGLVVKYLDEHRDDDDGWIPIPQLAERCKRSGPRAKPPVGRADVSEAVDQLILLGRIERDSTHRVRLIEVAE